MDGRHIVAMVPSEAISDEQMKELNRFMIFEARLCSDSKGNIYILHKWSDEGHAALAEEKVQLRTSSVIGSLDLLGSVIAGESARITLEHTALKHGLSETPAPGPRVVN